MGRIERGALKHIFYHMQNRAIWASLVAHPVKNLPTIQETQVPFLGQEDPLEKGMATHSSTLAWEPHRLRSLAGFSSWGRKG